MSKVPEGILRGRLSPAEIERIDEFSERGRTPGWIALRLNRHPATVNYAMHRLGHRKLVRRTGSYFRKGVEVKAFTVEEDEFVQQLRRDGLTTQAIGDLCFQQFGHRRSCHTILVRLTMLAGSEAA